MSRRSSKLITGPPSRALPNINSNQTSLYHHFQIVCITYYHPILFAAMLRVFVINTESNTDNKSMSPSPSPSPSPMTQTKPKPNPNPTSPPNKSNSNDDGGVVTNISKDAAKNALAGLFGAKSSPPKPKPVSNDEGGVVTNISKDDAKNALGALFGARMGGGGGPMKKAKPVVMDNGKINLKISTPPKLLKYEKLGKIMPVHVVENRMKMDGITKMLIGQMTKRMCMYSTIYLQSVICCCISCTHAHDKNIYIQNGCKQRSQMEFVLWIRKQLHHHRWPKSLQI